jgi:hypothetical protein
VADFMNFDPGKFFLNPASAFQVILVTNQAAGSKLSAGLMLAREITR